MFLSERQVPLELQLTFLKIDTDGSKTKCPSNRVEATVFTCLTQLSFLLRLAENDRRSLGLNSRSPFISEKVCF